MSASPISNLRRAPEDGGSSCAVIRRTPAWGKQNHPDTALDTWANGLESLVKDGADVALTRYNDLTGLDATTARWKETADRLVAYRDNPDTPPVGFGPAYYGYAIEAYALGRLNTLDAKLPHNFRVASQVTYGMTRPDIVVYDDTGADVGWFDITSQRSRGHIYKKTGSPWLTRPYVAEILYDNFDISRLAPGNTTLAERKVARKAYQEKQARWERYIQECRTEYEETFNETSRAACAAKGGALNAKEWARAARDSFARILGREEVELGMCRDLLRAFGIDPKAYGLGKGGDKQKGLSVLRSRFAPPPEVEEEAQDLDDPDVGPQNPMEGFEEKDQGLDENPDEGQQDPMEGLVEGPALCVIS